MEFETPSRLLARLKLGREEYCQRLLTSLILEAPYPKWNTRSPIGPAGLNFLRSLFERSYGSSWPGDDAVFVDELELPPRHDAEKGGAPDYGVVWADRVWLIELKTEKASHRAAQIPSYFELAHHHYPTSAIDVLYVTPPMAARHEPDQEWGRFAHTTWADLAPSILEAWPEGVHVGQREVIDGLLKAIDSLHLKPSAWREVLGVCVAPVAALPEEPDNTAADSVASALTIAEATAADGHQRAVPLAADGVESLLAARLALRDALAATEDQSPLRHVRPWIWRTESTGHALSAAGEEAGMELRVSRYKAPTSGERSARDS